MGIQKIDHEISGVRSPCRATNYHLKIKGGERNKNQASESDSGDDSDDADFSELNCEPAMVEGQICSIPYELYDLPDLKGILSIETWNLFLTEEERFLLSSYLPDMDQQTFNSTMEELLGGRNLYFGNPVDRFYQKLRGGLYPPKVACCRECLLYVQRKRYYYSLRSYHESMIQTFAEMRRLWDRCDKESGINERLLLWSKRRRSQKNLALPDLNRVPCEEEDNTDASTFVRPEKSKLWETNRPYSGTLHHPVINGDPKGILKIKASNNRVLQSRSPNVVFVEPRHQSAPKGLLKVAPKSSSETLKDKKPMVFPASVYLNTVCQQAGGSELNTTAELPKCVLNQQDTSDFILGPSQNSIKTRVKEEPAPLLLNGSAGAEQHLCPNQEDHVPVYPRFPNLNQNILVSGLGRETTMGTSTEPKNGQNDNSIRKPRCDLSRLNEGNGIKEDHLFSLTYKRRKVQRIHVA